MSRSRGFMDNLKIIVPGKPEYLSMMRLAISSVAATAGFDVEAVEDIRTAVCEACKNISCHGSEGFSDQYEVACSVSPGYMEIRVKDDCDMHTLAKEHKPCSKCPSEGNIGVFVIESLMSDVQFGIGEDGRKFIRMVKRT
jgi:serine/threonine-protein kinase RsbW